MKNISAFNVLKSLHTEEVVSRFPEVMSVETADNDNYRRLWPFPYY
jgi:hypothetical protein